MQRDAFPEAVQILSPANSACDPRFGLLLAAALEGTGDAQKAESVLQQTHVAFPANPSVATSFARLLLLAGRAPEAADALRSSPTDASTPPQEAALRATVYIQVHDLHHAQQAAELAFHGDPSVESLTLLANVYQLEGRTEDALTLLAPHRTTFGASPAFLITAAECEFDSGRYEAAHDDLVHAVSLQPNSYQAHDLLGNTLAKQGHAAEAVAEYQSAIALSPGTPRTFYQLALAYLTLNNSAAAEEAVRRALAIDPHYAPAHLELAQLLLGANRLPEAIEQGNDAIRDNPSLEQAYFLLVRAYARAGNKGESQAMLAHLQAVREHNRQRPRTNPTPP